MQSQDKQKDIPRTKKANIEFRDEAPRMARVQTSADLSNMQFTEINELSQSTIFNKVKSKREIPSVESDSSIGSKEYEVLHKFPVSLALLSCFRNPEIIDHQEFTGEFVAKIKKILGSMDLKEEGVKYAIYMHLMIAQVYNLSEFTRLGEGRSDLPKIGKIWNHTNIMNANCIYENVKNLKTDKVDQTSYKEEGTLEIEIISAPNVYRYNKSRPILVSKNYLDKAIGSQGFLDVYFCPLVINKFEFPAIYRNFVHCPDFETTQQNYASTFLQIVGDSKANIDFQKWYEEQVKKIINGNCDFNEIRNMIANTANGYRNKYIQRLLIGLQGWTQNSEEAIRMLNVYYDHSDWQIRAAFKPIIEQKGDKFIINYLIEDTKAHRELITVCVKSPCFNSMYNEEVFSWHRPKLNEYDNEENTYLWVQLDLGRFAKCGFYDWKLFMFKDEGKNQGVNKIFNMAETKKIQSQILKKKGVQVIKRVQGRFIVQPQRAREMQMHEIDMDLLSQEPNVQQIPSFDDASAQVKRTSEYGVDCVYLMGAFERDTGEFGDQMKGFKRPQASPLALTCRKTPCKMLGGPNKFMRLVEQSHGYGVKIITDCTQRVSSSRMNKRYTHLLNYYLDETGKKRVLYGGDGRSVNHEDTVVLNYRKKESWDIMLEEIIQVIRTYGIDGIYLDHGFSWPTIFELNDEELFRKDTDGSKAYSDNQIFEGEVVNKGKKAGYVKSRSRRSYSNPFIYQLCKKLWNLFPNLLIVCEGPSSAKDEEKTVSVINSGPIPRVYNMTRALTQVFGFNIEDNGNLTKTQPKKLISMKKYYQELKSLMPKNSIVAQSTNNHFWPYPAFIFKQATWAFIDLFFFLPEIPVTFIGEHNGRAFRSKAANTFISVQKAVGQPSPQKPTSRGTFKKINSSFFKESSEGRSNSLIKGSNVTVRDPHQIGHLQQNFRKQVGPEFGFDLAQIHHHYKHRSQLRRELGLISKGKMIPISAEHQYGIHTSALCFAKWDQNSILLVCINFNPGAIDLHFNLTNLKYIFTSPSKSTLVVRVKDALEEKGHDHLYTVSELITSKIEAHLDKYKTLIWRISTIGNDKEHLEEAYQSSMKRVVQRLSRQPPKWIHSSVLTNELITVVESTKNIKVFEKALNHLYEKLIKPHDIDFNFLISKIHEFWINRQKLAKLFALLKMVEESEELSDVLRKSIKAILEGNKLGPIAFVTPEIGAWSSVGGLGVMVDQLSKELVKLGEQVYLVTPYYEYNKKGLTNYLEKDGFKYETNIKVGSGGLNHEFGIHRGKYCGVNYIWLHNPELFSKVYAGEQASYVTKQLVFFALAVLQTFCQLKIFPSTVVTNDWMCGFVSAYVKVNKYKEVFNGTKFIHICHNLDPTYEGRLFPKFEEGNLNWLVQLPPEWYTEYRQNKLVINPSKCALETSDNWGTVSNSYKHDLLESSALASVLWKHPQPFSFPNGIRKEERVSIIQSKTPGTHIESKKMLQKKYFGFEQLNDDMPLFAFIGRVTKQKGVHLIVDAIEAMLFEYNFKVQFIVGGPSDDKEEYGKYCAGRMKFLANKYPKCVWADPDAFYYDGPLTNIGADYALMPSLFEPGGIVQHEFFAGKTPVVAFKTGGLKDTVFEYEYKTQKGNGFNFMSYDLEDFKRCLRRAIECYKNKKHYEKLRENAFESVVEEEDVAKGWNGEFYRMQNKIYVEWDLVDREVQTLKANTEKQNQFKVLQPCYGEMWKEQWETKKDFKQVLIGAARIKGRTHNFTFEYGKIPRPKEVYIAGSWDNWEQKHKMHYDQLHKNWLAALKLTPGSYVYKYSVEGEWVLNKNEPFETDINNNENHIVTID